MPICMIKSFCSLTIALVSAEPFLEVFTASWNTVNPGTSANNENTIPTNPAYTFTITGTFPAIFFNNTGDRLKITRILSWVATQWQSMEDAFRGCENFNFDAFDSLNLSQVTSLKIIFRACTTFNGIVSNWNLSTITNISELCV